MKTRPVSKCISGSFTGAARQRGIGLIEVLVAVLIMAIGLLGIAFMQTRALSNNNSSMGRSMAVIASYSILEAMRADRSNAIALKYNRTLTGDDCAVSPATTALAQEQLVSWCAELADKLGTLSSTSGTIDCDANGVCTVTVQFDDTRVGAQGKGGTRAQQVVTKAMI